MFGFGRKNSFAREEGQQAADLAAVNKVRKAARKGVGRFTEKMADGSTAYAYRIKDSVAHGIEGKDGKRRFFGLR